MDSPDSFSDLSEAELSADERYPNLRRPTTRDTRAFWYCTPARWNEWLRDLDTNRKQALNNLRKWNAAGRMMETDAGVRSGAPCDSCKSRGLDCMVYRDAREQGCAFCRRNGRGGCFAALARSGDEGRSDESFEHSNPLIEQLEIHEQDTINLELLHPLIERLEKLERAPIDLERLNAIAERLDSLEQDPVNLERLMPLIERRENLERAQADGERLNDLAARLDNLERHHIVEDRPTTLGRCRPLTLEDRLEKLERLAHVLNGKLDLIVSRIE